MPDPEWLPGEEFFRDYHKNLDEPDTADAAGRGLLGALTRNRARLNRSGIGSIAAGVAVFVAASIAIPLASADSSASHHSPLEKSPAAATPISPVSLPSVPAPAAARKMLPTKPTEVPKNKQAPVTTSVITGLARNGIPNVALNAYRVAAARLAKVDPSCGIKWWLLAGIGRVESNHGRFAGAVLHADGVSSPPIVGPALDGVHWDYIPVSQEYISITHDPTYAHALGPMQFIPSTWARYGADANGDGKADILDINDAALGAARYLCAAGGNLRTTAGQRRAVLAYNHSNQYLNQVLALADAYRTGVPVRGAPVGNVTGGLSKVGVPGDANPVNPAPPTAADKDAAEQAGPSRSKSKSKSGGSGAGSGGGAVAAGSGTRAGSGSGGSETGGSGGSGGGSNPGSTGGGRKGGSTGGVAATGGASTGGGSTGGGSTGGGSTSGGKGSAGGGSTGGRSGTTPPAGPTSTSPPPNTNPISGILGSITDPLACAAEGGTWHPTGLFSGVCKPKT